MAQSSLTTNAKDLTTGNAYSVTVNVDSNGVYSATVSGAFDQKCDVVQYDPGEMKDTIQSTYSTLASINGENPTEQQVQDFVNQAYNDVYTSCQISDAAGQTYDSVSYDPTSSGTVTTSDNGSSASDQTTVLQVTDPNTGGSQIEYFNPSSNITTETDNYTGAGGTGTLTSADVNFTGGTSEQDLYNPTSGVDVEFKDYSGLNETGTLEYQGNNWTAGGSQIEYFNPQTNVTTETDNYSGTYGNGTLSSADFNYTSGASEKDVYNPSSSSKDEFFGYSAANETGTLTYEGNNWTAGGSQAEFFDPAKGVATETDNYTGAYGHGELSSADLNLTSGFSLDYSFNYDASGNETNFTIDEFNSADQMVWSGEYSPSGGYLGGSGTGNGYSGPGGYYGGTDGGGYVGGGYGGGYDFAKPAAQGVRGGGSDVSGIAARDQVSTTSHWDASRPFAQDTGSRGANGKQGRGAQSGTDVGVIAAYDRSVSADSAAGAADTARQQAFASASGDTKLTGAAFEGAKIQGDVVTWSFATSPGTAASPFSGYIGDQYKAAIEQAVQSWAKASGLTFEEVPDSPQADIRIGWGNFDTSSSGVIGYTSYRQHDGAMSPGTIIRLEDPNGDALVSGSDGQLTYAGTQAELYQVALHEIGHALGLADNADRHSVMYYASSSANRTLDHTDISGIQSLYGADTAATTAVGSSSASARTGLATLGAPGSLSSRLTTQGTSQQSATPNPVLAQMVQAMGALHDGGAGWAQAPHAMATANPDHTFVAASHPH
ncbi:matrixin family metalloprotease [Bradyrhizobium sp.]|uniref:matrixin family metalloprotease n=1 Tax=Bradyrhizobium sp. TaxID=376 RepID=UPI0025BE2BD9|nr:matrixin family metalloprotease [Bradyrhizobium sp.]MBV8920637.1 matrixin family metalloprotease [Bradyrhizobium sp.]